METEELSTTLGTVVRPRYENPIVFMDIEIGREEVGRIIIELRNDLCPKTVENFRTLVTGEKGTNEDGVRQWYKGTHIHRVVRDMVVQGGDLLEGDGTWSESIWGSEFEDENFILRHTGPGVLSMMNRGPNSNGSQFQFSIVELPTLDCRYVVFGCVVDRKSMEVLESISRVGTPHGMPSKDVVISDCGQLFP